MYKIIVLFVLLVHFCSAQQLADFTIRDIDGNLYSSSDKKNTAKVIVFFDEADIMSKPIVYSLELLKKIYPQIKFVYIYCSFENENTSYIASLQKELDLKLSIYIDQEREVLHQLGYETVPITLVVDKENNVQATIVDQVNYYQKINIYLQGINGSISSEDVDTQIKILTMVIDIPEYLTGDTAKSETENIDDTDDFDTVIDENENSNDNFIDDTGDNNFMVDTESNSSHNMESGTIDSVDNTNTGTSNEFMNNTGSRNVDKTVTDNDIDEIITDNEVNEVDEIVNTDNGIDEIIAENEVDEIDEIVNTDNGIDEIIADNEVDEIVSTDNEIDEIIDNEVDEVNEIVNTDNTNSNANSSNHDKVDEIGNTNNTNSNNDMAANTNNKLVHENAESNKSSQNQENITTSTVENAFFNEIVFFTGKLLTIFIWGLGILYCLSKVKLYKRMLFGSLACLGFCLWTLLSALIFIPQEVMILNANFLDIQTFATTIHSQIQDFHKLIYLALVTLVVAGIAGRAKNEELAIN